MNGVVKVVSVCLSTRCNANCIMCWRRKIDGYGCDMSKEVYNGLIRSLDDYDSGLKIFLSTGEPTIAPYCEVFLEYCLSRNFKVILYSNGQCLPPFIVNLIERGLDITFGLSIDGGDEDTVARIQRGCSLGKMIQFVKRIRLVKSYRPQIVVNFIANCDNIKTLLTLINHFNPGDVDRIQVSPMRYFRVLEDHALEKSCRIDFYAYRPIIEEADRICQTKGITFTEYLTYNIPNDFSSACVQRSSPVVIKVNGDVLPCVGTESYVLGNITEKRLVELLEGEKKSKMLNGLKCGMPLSECKACSLSLKNRDKDYFEANVKSK